MIFACDTEVSPACDSLTALSLLVLNECSSHALHLQRQDECMLLTAAQLAYF